MTPERRVKNRAVAILKEAGAWYCFPPANGFGRAGVPDILVCHAGRFFAIECKADSDKNPPTALQAQELEAIRAAGGTPFVVDRHNVDGLALIFRPRTDK
jgi:Holliday junction resolvase